MDYEVKAGSLEASFDAVERQGLPVERPVIAGGSAVADERRAFVDGYLRRGLAGAEMKSFVGTTGAEGGYAVPRELDSMVEAALKSISPIRQIANVVRVGSSGYRKLVTSGGTPSGWVAEVAARPETDTPDFHEVAPNMGELYANPAASQTMLDDAMFDVEGWLANEIATEFAKAEGAAFVNGNGVNRPKGFLTYPTSTQVDGVRPFGTIEYLPSGAAGAFPASSPQDRLIDLIQLLRPPYRQGAVFVMNSATLARIRKFKTSDGGFLWAPGLAAGQPNVLLGYQSHVRGMAIVQNLFERAGAAEGVQCLSVSETSRAVSNLLVAYNSFPGADAGARFNWLYTDDAGAVGAAKQGVARFNLFHEYNVKTDTFVSGSTASGRVGNWRVRYGVGSAGNVIVNGTSESGNPGAADASGGNWLGEFVEPGSAGKAGAVAFVENRSGAAGAGSGDYRVAGAESAAFGRVPAGMAGLGFDLAGAPRRNDGAGAAGAYERAG